MSEKVTIAALQAMKREGKKSIGLVAWDYQIARIADRAGFDFISVGDSVGVNLWGRDDVLDVTLDEILICCKAVRRGTARALVSCDMPYGPAQQGADAALAAAHRLVDDGGADMTPAWSTTRPVSCGKSSAKAAPVRRQSASKKDAVIPGRANGSGPKWPAR